MGTHRNWICARANNFRKLFCCPRRYSLSQPCLICTGTAFRVHIAFGRLLGFEHVTQATAALCAKYCASLHSISYSYIPLSCTPPLRANPFPCLILVNVTFTLKIFTMSIFSNSYTDDI